MLGSNNHLLAIGIVFLECDISAISYSCQWMVLCGELSRHVGWRSGGWMTNTMFDV